MEFSSIQIRKNLETFLIGVNWKRKTEALTGLMLLFLVLLAIESCNWSMFIHLSRFYKYTAFFWSPITIPHTLQTHTCILFANFSTFLFGGRGNNNGKIRKAKWHSFFCCSCNILFFLLLSCRTMIMSAAMRLFRYVAAGACVCVHSTYIMWDRKRTRTYRRQCAIPWLHEWNGYSMCVVYKIVIFRAWCVYVCAGITDEKEMSKTLLREIAKQMIGNCQNRIGIYIALGS